MFPPLIPTSGKTRLEGATGSRKRVAVGKDSEKGFSQRTWMGAQFVRPERTQSCNRAEADSSWTKSKAATPMNMIAASAISGPR
jgi:hypothetical protein